jgi:hypothetical protein
MQAEEAFRENQALFAQLLTLHGMVQERAAARITARQLQQHPLAL